MVNNPFNGIDINQDGFQIDIDKYMNLPFNAYVKDISHRYLECNIAQANSCGVNINDIVGTTDKDLLYTAEAEAIIANDKEILTTGLPKVVIEAVTISDEKKPFVSYKLPIYNRMGEIVGLFGASLPLASNSVPTLPISNIYPALNKNIDPNFFFDKAIFLEGKKISKRESECLYYLIQGFTAKKIAQALDISYRTVECYIEDMKKKFKCNNKTELITKVLQLHKLA